MVIRNRNLITLNCAKVAYKEQTLDSAQEIVIKLFSLENTVYIGFCDYGFSGQSGYSDHNLVDGPPSLHNSDHGYNDLQFSHLYSEIATVNPFGGR